MSAILGWWFPGAIIARHAAEFFSDARYAEVLIRLGTGIVLGVAGAFLTPVVLRFLFFLSGIVERSLKNYTPRELLTGIVGMFLGAGLALVIILFGVMLIPQESLDKAMIVLIGAALVLIFGFIGLRIGVRLMAPGLATNIPKTAEHAGHAETEIKILDSSTLIDGRVLDIARTGFLSGEVWVPGVVLKELARIADCEDVLKKNRGRRGLDIVAALQKEPSVSVTVLPEDDTKGDTESRILRIAAAHKAKLVTVDYNLNKLAAANNVQVLNVNELANAIRPISLPGEKMTVTIVKKGKDLEQGVAYTPDGTMIVVENGGGCVGQRTEVVVSTALQTAAGRIIFTRIP
jgi:uncharacterized protein YacL